MYKLLSLFAALLLSLPVMVSCESVEPIDPSNPPVLEIERSSVSIGGAGGKCSLYYTVENGRNGVYPTYKCDVDWIVDVTFVGNLLNFTVEPSDTPDVRYGRLTISYEGAVSTRSIIVEQSEMEYTMFTIEVDNVVYNSCTVTYTPVDDNMLYIANIIDIQYFTSSGVSTAEAFIAAEMQNYIAVANSYGRTLEELIPAANLGGKGTIVRTYGSMQPGGKYVVYCYGIEVSGDNYTVTAPIHYEIVTLPMPTMYDVDFSASISYNTSYMATIAVTPNNWDGYYYIQIAPESSLYYVEQGKAPEDYAIKAMSTAFYKNARTYMAQGETAERYLNTMCYRGSHQISVQLEKGTRYMVIVFAVESEDGAVPVMRSLPDLFYCSTR